MSQSQVVRAESRSASIREAKRSGLELQVATGQSFTEQYNRGWNVIARYAVHKIRLIEPDAQVTFESHDNQDVTAQVNFISDTTEENRIKVHEFLDILHATSQEVCGGCGRVVIYDEDGNSQYSCGECPAVLKHIGRILAGKTGAPSPTRRRNIVIGVIAGLLAVVALITFVVAPAVAQFSSFLHGNPWFLPMIFTWILFGAAIYGILSVLGINRALKVAAAIFVPIGAVVVIAFLYARSAGRMISDGNPRTDDHRIRDHLRGAAYHDHDPTDPPEESGRHRLIPSLPEK